jgi:uncharacterized protein (DUF433 family)
MLKSTVNLFERMNLPQQLEQDAMQLAEQQGISLEQFVLWAVAEKVGALRQQAGLGNVPEIAWSVGASGLPTPVIQGTRIRVQTIAIAHQHWQLSPNQIATEYDLTEAQVQSALAFYATHRVEIDRAIVAEQALEQAHV